MAGDHASGPEPSDLERDASALPTTNAPSSTAATAAPTVVVEERKPATVASEPPDVNGGVSASARVSAEPPPVAAVPGASASSSSTSSLASDARPRGLASTGAQYAQGVAVAALVDAAFTVPWVLFHAHLRPAAFAQSAGILLLSANMLVGYAGGRAAGRAGLAHDDARSHWLMAWLVTLCSQVVEALVLHLRPPSAPAPAPVGNPLLGLVIFGGVVFLVRFGFAMGTWAQARREGRVSPSDEDTPR